MKKTMRRLQHLTLPLGLGLFVTACGTSPTGSVS